MSAQFFVSVIIISVIANMILGACAYLIFLERKVAAWVQDRIGPNRTNFSFGLDDLWNAIGLGWLFKYKHLGLGQALADGIKLLLKEDYNPPHVDKVLFLLAPAIVVIPALIGWAVVPWGGEFYFPGLTLPLAETIASSGMPGAAFGASMMTIEPGWVTMAVAPVNIGVVYILAIGSLAVYGVVLGAYASNNKYSFLGGLRATAQMLSYEIPMGVVVLIMILAYQSTNPSDMVNLQGSGGFFGIGGDGSVLGTWGIFMHPLLAAIFFTCLLAESNRAPFDLAEAEQELVGGFHTEYSSMKWALFFLAEYMHMITGCAFFTILFLGGWDALPFVAELPIFAGGPGQSWLAGLALVLVKFGIFAGKVTFLLFLMMWVRWTLPRLRFDQLMKLAWRGLIPITLVMLLVSGVLVYVDLPMLSVWLLVANVVVAVGAAAIGPRLPQGPKVNRRVPLAGSRFNPLPAE